MQFIDDAGIVDIGSVADAFHMTKEQRTEMLEIVSRIRDWIGGEIQAMAWYRSQPIPALDGRTPEALVKVGEAGAVRDYLDHLALGGYA